MAEADEKEEEEEGEGVVVVMLPPQMGLTEEDEEEGQERRRATKRREEGNAAKAPLPPPPPSNRCPSGAHLLMNRRVIIISSHLHLVLLLLLLLLFSSADDEAKCLVCERWGRNQTAIREGRRNASLRLCAYMEVGAACGERGGGAAREGNLASLFFFLGSTRWRCCFMDLFFHSFQLCKEDGCSINARVKAEHTTS